MKGIAAYDSMHGSTRQAAEAIAEQIRSDGLQADVVWVKDSKGSKVVGDFMFIGSPTRGGRMTKSMKEFIDDLDTDQWKNFPIVTFDTIGPLSKDAERRRKMLMMIKGDAKTAAGKMQRLCMDRGLKVHVKPLHLAVTGMWGPLAPDAPKMAKEFTHQFLATLRQ